MTPLRLRMVASVMAGPVLVSPVLLLASVLAKRIPLRSWLFPLGILGFFGVLGLGALCLYYAEEGPAPWRKKHQRLLQRLAPPATRQRLMLHALPWAGIACGMFWWLGPLKACLTGGAVALFVAGAMSIKP